MSSEPVPLVEVMRECQAMIEPQAHQRGINMTFPRFDLPYFVSADRTRVQQVLINLLFNAIKYNRPEGTVTVEYTLCPPNSIRISVRDTGAGLAPDQVAQLFQPFNRLGKEAGKEEGTGIGLVVTKRLVELMGGTIGADSNVDVGSVFWFELSLTTEPLLLVQEVVHEAQVSQRVPDVAPLRTVLYVEDNPANLELVEQLIERRPDLRLLSAADGNLGIEYAQAYLPDVILMDINLPGISGLEAMKLLRAEVATAHIPIIAVSANAMPRDIESAIKAGFFDYLTKPIKVNLFMDTLDAALNVKNRPKQERE
jgi:CheY-like chemotaxis protein